MTQVTLPLSKAELFERTATSPALIVVHEWWGINDDIRKLCERFRDAGYTALAVDLFEGKSTKDQAEAAQLANDMKTSHAMEVIADARKWLSERGAPKVAITGFCLGGGMALAAACTIPGIVAAVPFYGLPKEEFVRFDAKTPPILGHYAKSDAWARLDRAEGYAAKAKEAGAHFTVQAYDGGHAFMRKSDPDAYHEPSATLAWDRTVAFLKTALAG